MPAANTTYTATWTVNSYTIRFLNHDGTVLLTGSVNYGETPAYAGDEPTKPTDATYSYTFSGWSPAISAVSGAQDYTAQFEQTANVVASVKIGSTTTYYTTLADAFNKAETGDNALITMLQDVEELTATLVYNPTNAYTCTLDLNNHTISGAVTTANGSSYNQLLRISKAGSTFIITDNSGGENGKLHNEASINAILYGIYVDYGHLKVTGGVISAKNTDTSGKNRYTYGISSRQSASTSSVQVTITDGCVSAEGNYRAYALVTPCTTTISGGTIKAKATGSSGDARGIYVTANTDTITGNPTFYVEAYKNAYGVYATGITNSTRGTAYYGKIIVKGGVFNVSTTTTTSSYGAYVTGHTRTINVDGGSYNGIYGSHGELEISNGTFNVTAHTSTAIGVYCAATYVYTNTKPNAVEKQFEGNAKITGGTFHIKTDETSGTSTAEGVRSLGQTIISGGTFDIKANTSTAYGVHVYKGKTTINGNPSFTVRANATVYGASAGETPSETTGMPYDGELEINGGIFDVATTTKTSTDNKSVYGVRAYANKRQITNTASGYYIGNYASAGTVIVNGGEFVVDGNSAIAGIICSGIVTQPAATISEIACPAASATAKMTVNGGKFKVTGTSYVYATNDAATTANFKLQGGYFNIDDGISKYVAPKAASPYYCVPTTAADKEEVGSDYEYKVAVAYKLTWNLDGGEISVAGTPAGYVAVGDPITAPVVTKTGYTFDGWTPAVAATMPAANTTYTATWTMDEVGDRLDIVDWTATDLTINANGWKASGWPYTINGTAYEKGARAEDRTLTIPYSAEAGTLMCITVESGGTITSQHFYRVPFIETTTGVKAEDTIYVNSGTLAIDASTLTNVGGLYVRPGASVNITNGTLTVGKLVLRTLPWQAASISGDFTATKTYYTRIAPNKRKITDIQGKELSYEAASYYQFALPLGCEVALKDVKVSNHANTPYGNTWLLKRYNEKSRAVSGTSGDNWVALGEDANIQGGVGYEMFSNSAYYREFYFPVDPTKAAQTTSVSYDLGAAGVNHAGWNIVSSPLMATYTNTSNPETGLKVSWYLSDGSYDQVIPSYIYPAIPFSYQASEGQHSISFEGNAIVAAAPRRMAVEDEPVRLQWIHVDVKDAKGAGDQTSILSHPTRYEESYKTGIDVAKQSLTASRALVYSTHAYGDMAFAGVSDSKLTNGIPLVVYSPKAQELTISMRENAWLNRLTAVWLIDHETGIRTDLLWSSYTFDATEGTAKGRFTLMGEFKAPQVTTGVENGQSDQEPSTKARKVIIEDKIYIQLNGRMYDSTGKLVNQ